MLANNKRKTSLSFCFPTLIFVRNLKENLVYKIKLKIKKQQMAPTIERL